MRVFVSVCSIDGKYFFLTNIISHLKFCFETWINRHGFSGCSSFWKWDKLFGWAVCRYCRLCEEFWWIDFSIANCVLAVEKVTCNKIKMQLVMIQNENTECKKILWPEASCGSRYIRLQRGTLRCLALHCIAFSCVLFSCVWKVSLGLY